MKKEMLEQVIGKYSVVRANGAGVFAGIIKEIDGDTVLMNEVKRIRYWDKSGTTLEIAQRGLANNKSQLGLQVDVLLVFNVIEIIPCTEKAEKNIREYKYWLS